MTKKRSLIISLLFLCSLSLIILTGCGEEKSGNTISEPELTVDYLAGDYAEQLITDGAETKLGFIAIAENDGTYTVTITEKEVVQNADYDGGYYVADTNITSEGTLGLDARIVCHHDDSHMILTADDFIAEHSDNPDHLYTVYMLGDSVELILATDPESLLEK